MTKRRLRIRNVFYFLLGVEVMRLTEWLLPTHSGWIHLLFGLPLGAVLAVLVSLSHRALRKWWQRRRVETA